MEKIFDIHFDVNKIKGVEHIHMPNQLVLNSCTEFELKQFTGLKTISLVMDPQPVKNLDGMWHWKDCQWSDEGIGFTASAITDYAPYKNNEGINISCTQVTMFSNTWVWLFEIKQLARDTDEETEGVED